MACQPISTILSEFPTTYTHLSGVASASLAPAGLAVAMRWTFFLAACLLTGALLLPHGKAAPVVAGMLLAGLIQLVWAFTRRADGKHE